MRGRSVPYLLFIAALSFTYDNCLAQSPPSCDSAPVISAVRDAIIKQGTKDSGWLFRLGLNVPAFRMKDVTFAVEEVRTIGPWRKGIECKITMRMTTPVDVFDPNVVIATFPYVVVPTSGGGIQVELF